jgi:hypothetical protein
MRRFHGTLKNGRAAVLRTTTTSNLVRRISFTRGTRASARDSIRTSAHDSTGRAETETTETETGGGAAAGTEGLAVGAPSPVPDAGAVLRVESDGAGGWRMAQPLSPSTPATTARGGSVAAASTHRMCKLAS